MRSDRSKLLKFCVCRSSWFSKSLYDELWPVIAFGKILGCFPYEISGGNLCGVLSPFLFVYSVCVYAVVCYLSVSGLYELLLTYTAHGIQYQIIKCSLVVFRILLLMIIQLSWYNGCSMIGYFNEWTRFQSQYKHCMGKCPISNLKSSSRRYILISIVLIIPSHAFRVLFF